MERNIWLEHGVDALFRKKNFQTLCGIYILGHSGVEHEIDNLLENPRDNLRLLCECKTREVTVADVFTFSGKMNDVGCTRGYIFTTSSNAKKPIEQLARAKNISIISDVLKKSEKVILTEIKE